MLIQLLVEPPVNLLTAIVLGMAVAMLWPTGRPRRAGLSLAGLAFLGLVALSLPATARALLISLEVGPQPPAPEPAAIVILAGDDLRARPGGIIGPPDLGPLTLQRLRAGALLHRRTGLPILVSGGVVRPGDPPIARAMARVLAEEFAIPVRWIEDRSGTTWENAAFSIPMLAADGIGSAYIVTQAWHMRRSLLAFRHFGLAATPASSHLTGPPEVTAASFVPSAHAWSDSRYALHEWIGLAWYAVQSRR